jgi:hypothetical protein
MAYISLFLKMGTDGVRPLVVWIGSKAGLLKEGLRFLRKTPKGAAFGICQPFKRLERKFYFL